MLHVCLGTVLQGADSADLAPGRVSKVLFPVHALNGIFGGVFKLLSTTRQEFNAVIGGGVMRC